MMSSTDASQNSIPSQASASPSLAALNGPARLCKSCRKAHEALLGDDSSHWYHGGDNTTGSLWLFENKTGTRKLSEDEWPDLPGLCKSAEVGCGFCGFLHQALKSKRFLDACEQMSKGFRECESQKTVHFDIHYEQGISVSSWPTPGINHDTFLIVKAAFDGGFTVNLHFEMEATPDSPGVARRFGLKDPVIRDYAHEEITCFLRSQLSNSPSSSEHDGCHFGFLPQRLIEVGASSLRLVEKSKISGGPMKNPEYCALSYCWGPKEDAELQAKTTGDSYHENTQGLAFDKLSRVIQDAVTTTRALSIRYLWVDSLCIIQGDSDDWKSQCSQMNDVYGNARLTLIAASSRTCTEGFLHPNPPALRFPYPLTPHDNTEESFTMHFTHAYGEIKLPYSSSPDCFIDLYNDLHFSQWARRGWTFQEHAMAKEHIVFGTSGVYFGREGSYVTKDGEAGPISPQAYITSLQTNEELHRAWENVMLRYSARKESSFSKIKDLLPALSGLARQFGDRLEFESQLPVKYIAGH